MKIFSSKTVLKKNPSIETITTKEGIIISLVNNKKDCIYYLEKGISTKIWKLIDGKRSINEIKNNFITYNKIKNWQRDFNKFIYELFLKKLIIIKK